MKNKTIGFIFVEDDSTYNFMYDAMFLDVTLEGDFYTLIEKPFDFGIDRILRKRKVQHYVGKILNHYYSNQYLLTAALEKKAKDYQNLVVLFTNSSFIRSRYPASLLREFKDRYKNLKYVLLYVDIVNHPVSEYANFLRNECLFDQIYTVDKFDAEKYGFNYTYTPYSVDKRNQVDTFKNGVYFCGATKGREKEIISFYSQCKLENIKTGMDIICTDDNIKKLVDSSNEEIRLREKTDYLTYPEVLSRSLSYSCILEIVQKNQAALTLRAHEAVCYNRKLLTNNRSIYELEFYNPRYMQYFEKVEDIDWEWVKEDIDVDYGYNGEFSPIHLLEDICKRMNGDNK